MTHNFPRVVITGLGVVSPLGVGFQRNWHRLLENVSGVEALDSSEYSSIPSQVAARVPLVVNQTSVDDGALNFSAYFTRLSDLKSMSLASAYALVAAHEAIEESRLTSSNILSTRIGISIGNGMAGLSNTCSTWDTMKAKGIYRGMSPYYITQILPNSCAGNVSIKYKFQGPNVSLYCLVLKRNFEHSLLIKLFIQLCNSSACAAGVQAIGDGYNMIRLGHADVMVCGGAEATINPISLSGFARMRALSTKFNDRPKLASRPFELVLH